MVSRNDWPFQFMRPSQIRNLILLALLGAFILLGLTSTIANLIQPRCQVPPTLHRSSCSQTG